MKRAKFKDKIGFYVNLDKNAKEEIAASERKTLSLKLQELVIEEIQRKKAIGPENPIGISYNVSKDNKNFRLDNWLDWSIIPKSDISNSMTDIPKEQLATIEVSSKYIYEVARMKRTGIHNTIPFSMPSINISECLGLHNRKFMEAMAETAVMEGILESAVILV